MKHNHIIKLLEAYNSTTPEEIIFKEEIVSFIKQHEDCLERSLEIGHLTASAWLLNKII